MKQWGNNTKVLKTASKCHQKDVMKRIDSSAKPITTRAASSPIHSIVIRFVPNRMNLQCLWGREA